MEQGGQKCRNAPTWANAKRTFLRQLEACARGSETRVKVGYLSNMSEKV